MEANGTRGTALPTSSNSTSTRDDSEWRPVFLGFPELHAPALCAETDPDEFFPEKGGSNEAAKRVCTGCEARAECLEWALVHDERHGIWGGTSSRERRRIRSGQPAPTTTGRPTQVSREAVRRLTAEGLTAASIAEQLSTTKRTVERVRAELAQAAA